MKNNTAHRTRSLPSMPRLSKPSRRNPLGVLIPVSILILAAVLVFALRVQILTGMANVLVVSDDLQPADLIFVLNGDYNTRPFYASQLYGRGLAPRVVIVQAEDAPAVELGLVPNETEVAVEVMVRLGVPPEKIITLQGEQALADSTFAEAAMLRNYAETHPVERILLVTSAFHTRRAKWIIERELEGLPVSLEVAAVPQKGFDQTNWWLCEQGLITLNNEYIKLVYYLIKYH